MKVSKLKYEKINKYKMKFRWWIKEINNYDRNELVIVEIYKKDINYWISWYKYNI
jgi:hypothetical protein